MTNKTTKNICIDHLLCQFTHSYLHSQPSSLLWNNKFKLNKLRWMTHLHFLPLYKNEAKSYNTKKDLLHYR